MSYKEVTSTRIEELDGFRGVAVLGVILIHGLHYGPHATTGSLSEWFTVLAGYSWSGVEAFFILSGYLITTTTLSAREKGPWVRAFFIKRLARIMPAYLLLISSIIIVGSIWAEPKDNFTWCQERQWFFWTMTQNWITLAASDGWWPGNWWPCGMYTGHTWSLGVEMHFYLLWPLLAYKLSVHRLLVVSFAVIIGCFLLRILAWQNEAFWLSIYTNTFTRLDSLFWGVLVALAFQMNLSRDSIKKLVYAGFIAFLVFSVTCLVVNGRFFPDTVLMFTFGFPAVSAFYASIVLYFSIAKESSLITKGFRLSPLRFIGKYSYGLYLVHWPMMYVLEDYGKSLLGESIIWQLVYFPAIVVVCLVPAVISWHLIETPCNNFARRLSKK